MLRLRIDLTGSRSLDLCVDQTWQMDIIREAPEESLYICVANVSCRCETCAVGTRELRYKLTDEAIY